jgi:hypothetical protein
MQMRPIHIQIGSPFRLRRYGFALIAALGVLATLFIMVIGIATLAHTGVSAVALQEADARLDTLLNSLQNHMLQNLSAAPETRQTEFALIFPYGTGRGIIEPLPPNAEFYRQGVLNPVEGDIVMRLRAKVPYLSERLGRERHVLANGAGKRKILIVLKEETYTTVQEQREEQ